MKKSILILSALFLMAHMVIAQQPRNFSALVKVAKNNLSQCKEVKDGFDEVEKEVFQKGLSDLMWSKTDTRNIGTKIESLFGRSVYIFSNLEGTEYGVEDNCGSPRKVFSKKVMKW